MTQSLSSNATDEERKMIKELVLDYIENGSITSLANAILDAGFRLAPPRAAPSQLAATPPT